MAGNLEARMLAALQLLSPGKWHAEELLIETFAKRNAEESKDDILINQLKIEARNYYRLFVKLDILEKNYRPRSGMAGYSDILYKLAKDYEDSKKIIQDYVASQPVTNNTMVVTNKANKTNNT